MIQATARALKERFDELHREGMTALQTRDYRALGDAIRREREIIREHASLIAEQGAMLRRQREKLVLGLAKRTPPPSLSGD